MGNLSGTATASAAAASFGTALAQIVVYILEQALHLDVPTSIESSVQVVFIGAITFLAGQWTHGRAMANGKT